MKTPKAIKFLNKAQMEILGLAIVVVLILVATIFVARFLVIKAPTEYRKGFISSELASNMLSTFLSTAAEDCRYATMTELLQDCAQGSTTGGNKCCSNCNDNNIGNDVKSCQFVDLTATEIFGNTFDKWNMQYEFLAYTDTATLITKGKACKAEKRSKLFPIPVSATTMYVKLDICE